MQELNGQNVPVLDTQEINLIVDHVGLTEPPKLIMIDYVLKLVLHSIHLYLLQIPLDVVISGIVYHKDVMEDKSELHGIGSKVQELLPEQIMEINKLVSHIPWLNVTTTLIQLNIHHVIQFHQLPQLVEQLAQEIMLIITVINTKLLHHMVFQHHKLNKN